ncbi:hypothetical protein VOLCADRAFT_104761, partial [Volvox carteri f. nagariensis]
MAPSVKTYPRYLCRGRLYALSKFEITCVSCGRKYHSTSHAYNHVITHQCVQPHGGNNGTELFGLDAVAPNEMIAGRSDGSPGHIGADGEVEIRIVATEEGTVGDGGAGDGSPGHIGADGEVEIRIVATEEATVGDGGA